MHFAADALLIAHVSDVHVKDPSRHYSGSGSHVPPEQNLARLVACLEELAALPRPPDVVCLTGDLVEQSTDAEFQFLRSALGRCALPMVFTPGNHDVLHPGFEAIARDFSLPPRLPLRFVEWDTSELRRADFDVEPELEDAAEELALMTHSPMLAVGNWVDTLSRLDEPLARRLSTRPSLRLVLNGHVHKARHFIGHATHFISAPSLAYGIDDGAGWLMLEVFPRSDGRDVVAWKRDLEGPERWARLTPERRW